MKGVMKEDKLWQTGAFICQVHFCDHFTKVFLHQKNSTRKPTEGNLKTSKASGSLLACWKFLHQKTHDTNMRWMVDLGGCSKFWFSSGKLLQYLKLNAWNVATCTIYLPKEVATTLVFKIMVWDMFCPSFEGCFKSSNWMWEDFHGLKLKPPTSLFARCFCILARNHTLRWRGLMIFRNGGGWSETDGVRGWEVESLTFTMQKV